MEVSGREGGTALSSLVSLGLLSEQRGLDKTHPHQNTSNTV